MVTDEHMRMVTMFLNKTKQKIPVMESSASSKITIVLV